MTNLNKISIAVSVMNRSDRIISCLQSWVPGDIIDEIVLIDWSSTPQILSLPEIADFIKNNKKISFIREDNQEYFSLPKSYNKAILNAKNEYILKIDIDHILVKQSFLSLLENLTKHMEDAFFCCEHVTVEHWGIVFMKKTDFINAGMYNEKLQGWGHDDTDLYSRIAKNKKKYIMYDIYEYIYHNPHGDDLRVANYAIKDKFVSNKQNEIIARNS